MGWCFSVTFRFDKWAFKLNGKIIIIIIILFNWELHVNIVIHPFWLRLPWPWPSVDLWGYGSTYRRPPVCCTPHNGITLLWSCCSLTHDHTDPWMGISAGFSKPNICASQYCHCSNHSLNQNTKSNFTWMPQHKYLIMAENKSLSFSTLIIFPSLALCCSDAGTCVKWILWIF